MTLPALFDEAKRLGFFVGNLSVLPDHAWLYISTSAAEVTLDTLCLPTITPSRDMTDEECELLEKSASTAGLKCFLCRAQLEDVVSNLREQCPRFTEADLSIAINHYWKNDAFIHWPIAG
jgi:hypothetical protein